MLGLGMASAHAPMMFQKAQYWPRKRLEDYQNERLREVVEFSCRNVPCYRQLCAESGLRPEEIRTTGDLARLPILQKSMIRARRIDDFIHGDKSKLLLHRTSGTTGEQGVFYMSKEAEGWIYAAQQMFFKWGGFSPGERHLQTGAAFLRGFEKSVKDFVFNCHYVSAFDISDEELETVRGVLLKKRIKVLVGYASSLNSIASHVRARNEVIPLRSILSLGETLYPHYRETIESAFGCRVTDTYGCGGEGVMVAGQCERQRYHVCMPLTFVEIVNGKGERVPRGEAGRVVLTRLTPSPMPLIRYDVGDVSALSRDEGCECGRGFALMEPIEGRISEIITTPAGHRIASLLFAYILRMEQSVALYQVLQEVRDRITIKVVPGPGFQETVLRRVESQILEACKNDLKIGFEIVDDIPLGPGGKRRFVVSTVPFQ